MGDLVDLGKDPRRAIELMLNLIRSRGKTTCIKGNHESVLLSALGLLGEQLEKEYSESYVDLYSSETTFRTYGVKSGDLQGLGEAIPQEHLDFLLGLPWCLEAEEYLVVHSGLFPEEPYEWQLKTLWNTEMNPGQPWPH